MKTMLELLVVVVMAVVPAVARSQADGKTRPALSDPRDQPKGANYYPLKAGTKWHYQLDRGDGRKIALTYQIGGIDQIDGKELARLEVFTNGQKSPYTEYLQSTAAGVFRVRMNEVELSPPLCLVKYPVKSGQTWKADMSARGKRMKVESSQGRPEDIQVPAGKFRAIPCTIVVSDDNDKSINIFWFAEGVGIVKQQTENGPQTVTMELTRYEAAN